MNFYIFNLKNPSGFLKGEKPELEGKKTLLEYILKHFTASFAVP
jgi:hypothetical protein